MSTLVRSNSGIRVFGIARALLNALADDRKLAPWAEWESIAPRSLTRRFVVETGFRFTEWQ